jgi:hypothetical protein
VLNSIRRAEDRCREDQALAARVDKLRAAIHTPPTASS